MSHFFIPKMLQDIIPDTHIADTQRPTALLLNSSGNEKSPQLSELL